MDVARAQPGGLGCLVDAGISPQEVCIADHIFLGGSPTIPPALLDEVESIEWTVLTEGVDGDFFPNPFVANPQVFVTTPTTFLVELTLTDGSSCSNEITLLPIEQPTIDLQGSWTQCDGSTELWFYNTSPSNSISVTYDVDWGDGSSSESLPFASAFEHNYDAQGAYDVEVTAHLGSCTNTSSIEVFLGSPPETIELQVPENVCSDGELEFDWGNLDEYPLGSSWQITIDGTSAFSGLVNDSTSTDFSWTFPPPNSCTDVIQTHTVFAQLVNACLPSVSSQSSLVLGLDPIADMVLQGDSCELVQLTLGNGVECPDAFNIDWNFSQNGSSLSPTTISGGNDLPFWTAALPPGEYEASLQIGNETCGFQEDTLAFCIEMPAPTNWGNSGLSNGGQVNLCSGDSLVLWIDSLQSICGSQISTNWTLSALSSDTQLSNVNTFTETDWSRGWTFNSPGIFLIELDGTSGCGALNLFAEVVVTELPTLELFSYDDGVPDSVLCPGDQVSVIASVSGFGLENGAYDLQWEVMDNEGNPHPSAQFYQFGDSTLVIQSSPVSPAIDIVVAMNLTSACGLIQDTLTLQVEGNLMPEFWLLEGNYGPENGDFPEFTQCVGDTLVIGFDVPGVSDVNVYSQTLDLWDIVYSQGNSQGELHWLSSGLNWDFDIEFVSEAGCNTYETIGFRSIFLPEVYVDAAELVCFGDTSQFEAVVFPGSSDSIQSITWSVGGNILQASLEPTFQNVMPECSGNPLVLATVTDEYGCQSSVGAVAPISCPSPVYPEALSCSYVGDTVCVLWDEEPLTNWEYLDAIFFNEDSTETCVLVDTSSVQYSLSWISLTELGCPQANYACWAVGGLDSLGECLVEPCNFTPPPPPPPPGCETYTCLDSTACNFGLATCCLDSCVYPEDVGPTTLSFDTLVFCQSWTDNYHLSAESPWIGQWSGHGVYDDSNAGCGGTEAWLDLSEPNENDIYFTGGVGSCSSIDTVHVVVQAIPTYDGPSTFSECHGTELDLGQYTSGEPDFCWNLQWLGMPIEECDSSATWLVNGSGYVTWYAKDANECTSLNTSIYIHDLGEPNAIVGGDTTLCNQAIPNAMQFEFGAPYALGCNPVLGQWEGEGASYDYFAEVWSQGNCIEENEPWIDSLWTFTPPGIGDFDWIWTVIDCNGCSDTDTLTIHVVEPTPPVLPQLTFCMNDPVGPVTGQTEACWIGPGISPDYIFDPVAAGVGVHSWVVGVGEGSCAMTDSIEVEIFDSPEFVLEGLGPWPCADEPYSMCIELPEEGDFPWTFEWSSFPSLEAVDSCTTACCNIQNVDATNVTATVTTVNGCDASDSWVINLASTPAIVLEDTLSFCNDGAWHPISSDPLGGVWSGPNVNAVGSFLAHEVGIFTLTYTYTNNEDCSDTDSLTVVVTDIPAPVIATPNSGVCLGSPLILQSSDEGVWSGPGISANGVIQQSQLGTYTYHLTSGVGSCLAQDSVDITFWPVPELDLANDTILCAGTPIEIEFTEEQLFAQSIVSGFALGCEGLSGEFPSFVFEPENTCSVSIIVEDIHGCTGYSNLEVIVPQTFPSYAGPPEVLCIGEEMTLSGQIVPGCATDVVWEGDVVDQAGNVNADSVGLHWLELSYIDCYGCAISGLREILILDVPHVEFAWEDSVVCAGQEVDANISSYGGSISYEWLWNNGENIVGLDTPWVAVNNTNQVLYLEAGVVASNICGSDTVWSPIEVNPVILVSPSSNLSPTPLVNDTLCAPLNLNFFADAPGATGWVWSDWMTPDTSVPGAATFEVPWVPVTTDYSLSVQAGIGNSLCSNPLEWIITVVPEPIANLEADMAFECGDLLIPGIDFEALNGQENWSWTGGELPLDFPIGWWIDDYGETTLQLTVTSEEPGTTCEATESISLSLHPQPQASFQLMTDSVVCAPGTFEILDTSQDAQEISWFVDYVGGSINSGETLNLLLPIAGQYNMIWAALGEGGCNDTLFVEDVFHVLPSPNAAIWSNEPAFIPWTMEGTEFVFNDISSGGDSTIWTVADSTIINEAILNFFYEDPGTYAVNQQVYNEFGCQDTASFRFEIIDELAVHIPTAFTPNGDEINEAWKPVIAGESRIEDYHLQVISRSGQLMFETFDPNASWDALDVPRPKKLEDVQNSIFMYVLRLLPEASPLDPLPEWRVYQGHVMILD